MMEILIIYNDPKHLEIVIRNNDNPNFILTSYPPNYLHIRYPKELEMEMFDYFITKYEARHYYRKTILTLSDIEDLTKVDKIITATPGMLITGPLSLVIENHDEGLTQDFIYNKLRDVIQHDFYLSNYEEYHIKMRHNFSKLFQLPTDVELHVDGMIFKAHKLILMGISDYFFNRFLRWDTNTINIDNINADLFKDLLDLIYGIDVPLKGLLTLELLQLAHFFQISNIDMIDTVKHIKINSPLESNIYIELINEIFPFGIPRELYPYIKQNITNDTDLSMLPEDVQIILK